MVADAHICKTLTSFGFVLAGVAGLSHPVHVQVVTQFLSVSSQHRLVFDRSLRHVIVRIDRVHYIVLRNICIHLCMNFLSSGDHEVDGWRRKITVK